MLLGRTATVLIAVLYNKQYNLPRMADYIASEGGIKIRYSLVGKYKIRSSFL